VIDGKQLILSGLRRRGLVTAIKGSVASAVTGLFVGDMDGQDGEAVAIHNAGHQAAGEEE
jgi:hypothetical protein